MTRLLVVALISLVLCNSACTSASEHGIVVAGQRPLLSQLPSLPISPGAEKSNEATAFQYLTRKPHAYFERSTSAVPDETAEVMHLASSPGQVCWAIYSFENLDLTTEDSYLQLTLAAADAGTVFVGLPDYSRETWQLFSEPVSSIDTVEIPLPATANLTSSVPGDFYFAVMTWGGMDIDLTEIELHRGLIEQPPANLQATDGLRPDRIYITWDPVESAEGYELHYKRSTEPDTAWQYLYAALGELNLTYEHIYLGVLGTDPEDNVQYDYRVRTVYESDDVSEWSEPDSGYRYLAPPWSFFASDGMYPDKIYISWSSYSDITRFNIYYKEQSAGEEAWELLYEYDRGVDGDIPWFHTRDTPAGKGCGFQTVYNYRISSVLFANESAPTDGTETGYRDVDIPQNLIASYNIYADRIKLSWNEVEGAEFYLIDRSTNGINWSFLDMTTQTTYDDQVMLTLGDYYYRVQAAVSDGQGDSSASALGSRLGWSKSDIDYDITANPKCDIAVLDNLLCVAYINASESQILFAHASDPEPGLPADWELSTVRSGSGYNNIKLDIVGGWPALAYDEDGSVYFSVAYQHEAGVGYSFRHTEVDGDGLQVYSTHFREFGLKPTVSYIRHDSGETGIYFAYSSSTSPSSNDDWYVHRVASVSDDTYSQALLEGVTGPRIAYITDDGSILKYATSSVTLPSSPANWAVTEILSGDHRTNIHLISSYINPLIAYRYEPIPSSYVIQTKISEVLNPSGPEDWRSAGGVGGQEDNLGSYLDLAYIHTGPGICFRDNDIDSLCYIAAADNEPVVGGWGMHTVDSSSDCGQACALASYNNLPAIVYWDYEGQRLRLARGL
jgi:hypothetical protein